MKVKDADLVDRLDRASEHMSSLLRSDGFLEPSLLTSVDDELSELRAEAERRSKKLFFRIGLINKGLKESTYKFLNGYERFPDALHRHNQELARSMAKDVGKTINPVEGRDLDTQQLSSIAMDVDTRLVIAGAGTGKTTTIVGLVKHLLSKRMAAPDEILLLSFTNASVDELKSRVLDETGQRIDVTTFHRLGLRMIASSGGRVPRISNVDINAFVLEEIERKVTDRRFLKSLNEFVMLDFESGKDEDSFKDRTDYERFIEENPLYTLNGERVKSFGEADIANFLLYKGIPYTYEEPYVLDTTDGEHGQYRPDFHIRDTDVYIEYFGTDREGNVARFMTDRDPDAARKYNESMEWKRSLHRDNGTRLIELFAYNRTDGDLCDILERELSSLGIKGHPMSPEEMFRRTLGGNDRKLKSIASTLSTAILLIKGYGRPWEEVYPTGRNLRERRSLERIEGVLRPLYDGYQSLLSRNDEIDFEDMLTMATECVRSGYQHPYRYVIVDEYQDISRSRYSLLKEMRSSRHYRLFCVGDDWQSIYRFNGSDVSYIMEFERFWGPSEICRIETTYRFAGEILKKSSEFVMSNPRQHRKSLIGKGYADSLVIPVHAQTEERVYSRIANMVGRIPENESVLFLGRYRHDIVKLGDYGFTWRPDIGNGSFIVTYEKRPELGIRFMTIHGSKGLQADHVFILNNRRGAYGFPSMREESVLIRLLLSGENSLMDEERRLFYVALTRARRKVYLAAVQREASVFFKELFGDEYYKPKRTDMTCPECGGRMVLKRGQFGEFYGCSNYSSNGCRYTKRK